MIPHGSTETERCDPPPSPAHGPERFPLARREAVLPGQLAAFLTGAVTASALGVTVVRFVVMPWFLHQIRSQRDRIAALERDKEALEKRDELNGREHGLQQSEIGRLVQGQEELRQSLAFEQERGRSFRKSLNSERDEALRTINRLQRDLLEARSSLDERSESVPTLAQGLADEKREQGELAARCEWLSGDLEAVQARLKAERQARETAEVSFEDLRRREGRTGPGGARVRRRHPEDQASGARGDPSQDQGIQGRLPAHPVLSWRLRPIQGAGGSSSSLRSSESVEGPAHPGWPLFSRGGQPVATVTVLSSR